MSIGKIQFEGIEISRLMLGAAQLGMHYGIRNISGVPSSEEALAMIQTCEAAGINAFDTAQVYGDSEKILGESFEKLDTGDRLVITKISTDVFRSGSSTLRASIDSSIERLKSPRALGVLLHDSKALVDWCGQDDSRVSDLLHEGKICFFGVSIYDGKEFDLALEIESVRCFQIPMNVLDQRAVQERWLERAKSRSNLVLIRSIFLQGLLLDDEGTNTVHSELGSYLIKIDALAQRYGCTRKEFLLSFVKNAAPGSVMVLGAETLDQVKENISIFCSARSLSDNDFREIASQFEIVPPSITDPRLWKT